MKTFVFDLDGTIVQNGKPVDERLSKQLQRMSQQYQLVFASARPVRDMLPLLPLSVQDSILIRCNGGMAKQGENWLFSHVFDEQSILKILSWLDQQEIPYLLDGTWKFSVSATFHPFHDYVRSLSTEEIPLAELLQFGVTKVLILDGQSKKECSAFLDKNGYKFNLNYHKSDDLYDITPQKENKYQALQKLGIKDYVACGNDSNDFAMLDHADIEVFLGNERDYPNADYYCQTNQLAELLA